MHLLDQIIVEIRGRNLLGEIKYVCLNSKAKQELIADYEELFKAEFEELGRKPNKHDIEEYFKTFKIRVVVDEDIPENQKYLLLTTT